MAGMMTGLLLLLLAGVTVGRVVDLQKRILGGKECAASERLYHVQLIDEKGEIVCGGSLINNQWILTAAHCVKIEAEIPTVLRVNRDGQRNRFVIDDIRRKATLLGEEYVFHDIVLLRLSEAVTGDAFVGLPECSKPPPPIVQIAGHGATKVNPDGTRGTDSPIELQCADTKVAKCTNTPKDSGYYSTPDTLFCFQDKHVDISPGDSGGGVVFKKKIYGVISFLGGKQPFVSPAGAVKVCEYIEWIKRMMTQQWTCTICV